MVEKLNLDMSIKEDEVMHSHQDDASDEVTHDMDEEYEEDFKDDHSHPSNRGPPINHWNIDLTSEFREYAYQSAGLSWMFGEDAAFYNSRNNLISLVTGIFSILASIGVAGAWIFIDTGDCDTNRTIGYYILSAIAIGLNLIVAGLTLYKFVKRFDHKIAEHSEKSSKYGKLYRKLKGQFARDPEDREDALDLLIYTEDRYDELDREKPFLRGSTVKKWGIYMEELKSNPNYADHLIPLPTEFRNDQGFEHFIGFRGIAKNEDDMEKGKSSWNPFKRKAGVANSSKKINTWLTSIA